jgi:prepilin-type N-terminal cleavage/methylation domain-containing protein
MTHRKGYTLIELMIGLVILGIVTGALYKLLVTTQRVSRAQTEHVDLQTNMRGAALIVPNELREINTVVGGNVDQNDILAGSGANVIQYRAMRGIGFICESPAAGGQVKILVSTWSGLRNPDGARDDGYVFIDGDENKSADDIWQPVTITGVANSTCGGAPAFALTISPTVGALVGLPVNTPVRLYEVMELSMYANSGQWWLGARSVSGGEVSPQPLVGPLDATANAGFNLSYRDGNNAVTADLTSVKSIRIGMKSLSSYNVASGTGSTLGQLQETDSTQVVLRNAFRP